MAELQIIGAPLGNFVWACRIFCAEKGVPYTLVPVMAHAPEVEAIHPLGKIPAMRHGDVTLGESRAIIRYIDEVFPGPSLVPSDPVAGATCEQWVSIVSTALDPVMLRQYLRGYLFPGTPDNSPNRAFIEPALPVMEKQFALLDRTIAATGYLAGDSFTLADAYLAPILYYMSKPPESRAMLAKSAALAAYLDRQLGRKSIRETMPTTLPLALQG